MNYSRGSYVNLPTDDADLTTLYTVGEIVDVDSDNGVRVEQGGTAKYMIHQFRDFAGTNTNCTYQVNLQTSLSPALSPVVLQFYNHTTSTWVTMSTYTSDVVNTDFNMTVLFLPLSDYKDVNNVVSSRVYQLAI
jgi:hypothetical protein